MEQNETVVLLTAITLRQHRTGIQHLAIEPAGKRHRIAQFLELETEMALAARKRLCLPGSRNR
jgi:hypothetical protein